MSRIGKLPIPIPKGVKITVGKSDVTVEGPKGKLLQDIQPEIIVKIKDELVNVSRKNDSKRARALHGLYRKLISNMVIGVTVGFSKTLLINGVGYRVEDQGKSLLFNLGYSNPVEFPLEEGLTATLEGNSKLTLSGIDKQQVGQACAEIRSIRPPEPYKGKGVRYENEYVRRKIGKAGIK
jgi:large subunit ribosomal protein L6